MSTPEQSLEKDSLPVQDKNLYLDVIDSLLNESASRNYCISTDSCFLNVFEYAADSVPELSDETMTMRLAALDAETPIDLAFRPELASYLRHYTTKRKSQMGKMLGLSRYYFPLYEEKLDAYNLPLELKYLSIVESALNPTAQSRVGAKGLWQFMYRTGKAYDLNSNSYYDERMDPEMATEAACRYLQKLHGMYGDWLLALAAYNAGPGNVNKAMRRSGKKTYWGIRPYLPRETRGYVPALIAVIYSMNFATEHNIYPNNQVPTFFECDTVMVNKHLRFDQIAEYSDITIDELEWFNPMYTKKAIPGNLKPLPLRLPVENVKDFLLFEDSMLAFKPKPIEEVKASSPSNNRNGKSTTYTVRSGDVLGLIAQRNGVSVRDLKSWNNIRGNMIKPGQKLKIYGAKNTTDKSPKKPNTLPKESDGEYLYHTIRKGDTLWDIAKLYPGVSADNIKQLNPGLNSNNLKLGQKIKIKKV
ncbi:MAG: LysM peptidoglycan-binding domain-containing protein [Flavobacteriales bacterium]